MSLENPEFELKGTTRAERVDELERVFQRAGDSDHVSFGRAILYERLMEGGLPFGVAAFFEKAIGHELHSRLANGLEQLRDSKAETST